MNDKNDPSCFKELERFMREMTTAVRAYNKQNVIVHWCWH